jgi:hypothetical protein
VGERPERRRGASETLVALTSVRVPVPSATAVGGGMPRESRRRSLADSALAAWTKHPVGDGPVRTGDDSDALTRDGLALCGPRLDDWRFVARFKESSAKAGSSLARLRTPSPPEVDTNQPSNRLATEKRRALDGRRTL